MVFFHCNLLTKKLHLRTQQQCLQQEHSTRLSTATLLKSTARFEQLKAEVRGPGGGIFVVYNNLTSQCFSAQLPKSWTLTRYWPITFQVPIEVVRPGPVETAAVSEQRSKFADQFAAIAQEHARSDSAQDFFWFGRSQDCWGARTACWAGGEGEAGCCWRKTRLRCNSV